MTESLWTAKEVAAFYKVHPRTVRRWARQLVAPPHLKTPGGKLRFEPPPWPGWGHGAEISAVQRRLRATRQDRQDVFEQAKLLADRAAFENRAFTEDEQLLWMNLNATMDHLEAEIRRLLSLKYEASVPGIP